jgi:hypothetical protein
MNALPFDPAAALVGARNGHAIAPPIPQGELTMALKRSTYYADDVLIALDLSENSAESMSGRVGFMIMAAAKAATDNCPPLTLDEWCAVVESCNGMFWNYEQGPEAVVSGMAHNLFDSAEEGDEKWDVDCAALAKRIARLPFVQQLAIFEVVHKYWSKPRTAGGGFKEAFEAIGANVSESE